MARNKSKKRQPIPEPEIKTKKIPQWVTQIAEDSKNPYVISFKHFHSKLSNMKKSLEKARTVRVLECFAYLGECYEYSDLEANGIMSKDISNMNDYTCIYSSLPNIPDKEIKELCLGSKGRMFYFLLDRTFYVVAILNNHRETDKIKR